VKVYPTDYNRDFALGFVDWNPYPPDNGTGIWRDMHKEERANQHREASYQNNTDRGHRFFSQIEQLG